MYSQTHREVLTNLKKLRTSGEYSDLLVICGSDTHKVHKAIVCTRCDFFARATSFPGQESQSNTIRFPDDEPETIKLLMNYLYEGEYDPELVSVDINASNSVQIQDKDKPHTCFGNRDIACTNNEVCAHHTCGQDCSSNCRRFVCLDCVAVRESYRKPTVTGDASQLMTHVKMYGIADKYGVLGLKDLSQEKFRRACRSFWNDANFATAAHDAFLTTLDEDKGLRDIVSQIISDHMELLQKPEIEVLFVTFNGLAYGLLKEKQAQGLV